MNKLRKIIIETLEKSNIFEEMKTFLQVPPSVGLVISKSTSDQLWLNLFDFKEKKCVGIITLRKFSDRAWGVTTVAAEAGFGPRMYELGMMAVYPSGICTDRIGPTNNKAFSVWKQFADLRTDITKKVIKPGEEDYSSKNLDNVEKNYLDNILYFRNKSVWFNKLIDKGNRLMDKVQISPNEISEICREYFTLKYKG